MSPRSIVFVEDQHHARAERRARCASALEGQGHLQLVRPDEHSRGTTQQHRADRLPAGNPAGQRDEVSQGDAEIDLVDARARHASRKRRRAWGRSIPLFRCRNTPRPLRDESAGC